MKNKELSEPREMIEFRMHVDRVYNVVNVFLSRSPPDALRPINAL